MSFVLTSSPTLEEESLARSISTEIDERRRAQSLIDFSIPFLASDNPREVGGRHVQNYSAPGRCCHASVGRGQCQTPPTRRAGVESDFADGGTESTGTLAIPAFVAVLKRPNQKENWPDAFQALERMKRPGVGEPLLDLALTAKTPEMKIAALTALAKVTDIPPRTVVALLPLLGENTPALAAALIASLQAVQTLDQTDLAVHRNLDVPLTADDEKRLAALPQRLLKLAAGGEKGRSPPRRHNWPKHWRSPSIYFPPNHSRA